MNGDKEEQKEGWMGQGLVVRYTIEASTVQLLAHRHMCTMTLMVELLPFPSLVIHIGRLSLHLPPLLLLVLPTTTHLYDREDARCHLTVTNIGLETRHSKWVTVIGV